MNRQILKKPLTSRMPDTDHDPMERTPVAVRENMEDLQKRCRAAGMNVTPQRLAVCRALLESEEHPTPEILYRKVRCSMPSLSLATIYKALDVLESLGLVRAIGIDSESRRYDANRNRHHHLVCRHCRKVVDFYDAALDQLRPLNRIAGFVTESVSVNISGLCEKCRRSGR